MPNLLHFLTARLEILDDAACPRRIRYATTALRTGCGLREWEMRGGLKLALLGLVILGAAGCSESGTKTKATCKVQNGGCDPLTTCTETSTDTTCSDCPSGYSGTGKTGDWRWKKRLGPRLRNFVPKDFWNCGP